MGQNKPLKYIPKQLGAKLRQIRVALGLTQEEMLKLLDLPPVISQTTISAYERNAKLPPYFVLARYGDVANLWIDVLVRDSLDLPDRLPSPTKIKHGGVDAPPTWRRNITRPRKEPSRGKKS
jgi:transcriptional regulator with XRE-family HTH domain